MAYKLIESIEAEVAGRYESSEGVPVSLPAVVVLQNFDMETGRVKRGKKPVAVFNEKPFTEENIQRFIAAETLPPVIYMPTRGGVDESNRYNQALSSDILPVLTVYSRNGSELEALRAAILEVGRGVRGDAIVVQFDIGSMGGEASDAVLDNLGVSAAEMKERRSMAVLADRSREQYVAYSGPLSAVGGPAEGAVEELKQFVINYCANRPAMLARPKKASTKSSSGKKKTPPKKRNRDRDDEL